MACDVLPTLSDPEKKKENMVKGNVDLTEGLYGEGEGGGFRFGGCNNNSESNANTCPFRSRSRLCAPQAKRKYPGVSLRLYVYARWNKGRDQHSVKMLACAAIVFVAVRAVITLRFVSV